MKNVVIGGTAYCGSTLLSLVLGSLPHTKTVGESHWLTHRWIDGKRKELGWEAARMTPENYATFAQCRYCEAHKRQCPYLTMDFRVALQADPSDWYAKIAAALGTDQLISSDKVPSQIKLFDPTLDHDILVPFKSPAKAWASANRDDRQGPGLPIAPYLDRWTKRYETLLDSHENTGQKLFLRLSEFTRQPARTLQSMCDALEIQFSESALRYWDFEHHHVGGNFHVYYNVMKNERQVDITPPPPLALSSEESEAFEAHAASRATYTRMLARHEEIFGE